MESTRYRIFVTGRLSQRLGTAFSDVELERRPGQTVLRATDGKKQLESGYLGIVNNIHHRRFPLIDEERGVVWSNCVFDMDGTVAQIKLNTGEVADMSSFAGRASSIHVTEGFRIENNLIRRVEMIGTGVPYHFNSSWGAGLSGK